MLTIALTLYMITMLYLWQKFNSKVQNNNYSFSRYLRSANSLFY